MTLDHIGDLPEVVKYESYKGSMTLAEMHRADDALAAADREVGRLKCCGNCDEWHPSGHRCYMGDDGTVFTDRMDPCHFTPSRWAERSTP